MCAQDFRSTMALTCAWAMPNIAPISVCSNCIVAASRLMMRISSALSLECGCCAPRLARPFTVMSRLFMAGVPRNRWAGLTQARLSQWWQTNRPLGISPCAISQLARCAFTVRPPVRSNIPYPSVLQAVQIQQSLVLSTFAQNRASSLADKISMLHTLRRGWFAAYPGASPFYNTSLYGVAN